LWSTTQIRDSKNPAATLADRSSAAAVPQRQKKLLLRSLDGRASRTTLSPHADCESMCAFVLLAGVRHYVPPEGRVRVHGIWFGDRRHNARAASYSAEDLAVLQHDVGLLAQYTVRMGGSIDLLETAARVPPWEPLRSLSQEELRGMRLTNSDYLFDEPPEPVVANSSVRGLY